MKQLPFLNDAAGPTVGSDLSRSAATPAAANPQRPAIIVPVQAIAPEEIARECTDIAEAGVVDVIEWRIDPLIASCLAKVDFGAADSQKLAEAVLGLASNVTSVGLPVIVTLRTGFEGGTAAVSEGVYTEILTAIITGLREQSEQLERSGQPGLSAPATAAKWALDVEIDRRGAGGLIDKAHEHGVPVVASHHNFAGTDTAESLLVMFAAMAEAHADVAKIAMMPQSHADVAELLRATALAEDALDAPVLGISMGRLGRTSRVMGGDFGSCASFAQLGESSAPGQIAVADLAGIFDRLYG